MQDLSGVVRLAPGEDLAERGGSGGWEDRRRYAGSDSIAITS